MLFHTNEFMGGKKLENDIFTLKFDVGTIFAQMFGAKQNSFVSKNYESSSFFIFPSSSDGNCHVQGT